MPKRICKETGATHLEVMYPETAGPTVAHTQRLSDTTIIYEARYSHYAERRIMVDNGSIRLEIAKNQVAG